MTDAVMQEMLDELFSSLQALETQTGAILQFLKERNLVSDEDLAPFWEKAANASSVRWRATRVRMNHLLSSASKTNDISQEKSPAAPGEDQQAGQQPSEGRKNSEEQEKPAQGAGDEPEAEKENSDSRRTNEGSRRAEGNAPDRPADKEAA